MMSLLVWLPGPMFFLEGLCSWSHVPSRGGGLHQGELGLHLGRGLHREEGVFASREGKGSASSGRGSASGWKGSASGGGMDKHPQN